MKDLELKQKLFAAAGALKNGNISVAKEILGPLHQNFPGNADVNSLVADLFVLEGHHTEAAALLYKFARRKSKAINPALILQKATSICAHHNVDALGLDCARAWVKADPKSQESRFFLALFLSRHKRFSACIELFNELVKEGTSNAWVFKYLAEAQMFTGQQKAALQNFEKGIALAPEEANFRANFLYSTNAMPFLEEERVAKEHLDYGSSQELKIEALVHEKPDGRPLKLRLGFMSGEFRCHSITYFFLPLLRGIDLEKYEIFCYSDTEGEDAFTEQIKSFCTGWRETKSVASETILKWVQEDHIDVLMDLNGYTGKFRFEVFASKAAPIQVSYLGYPNTTGLSRIDYRLADERTDPVSSGNDRYSEQLLRLPGGFLCFEADPEAPEPSLSEEGIEHVRFGSFNAFQKVNDEVIDCWAAILNRVESSTLLFKSFSFREPEIRQRLKKKFEERGVSGNRLILLDHTPSRREHLALYEKVDIHLDTFPYNGTTTTCEALWQGVPTLTFSGESHRARVGTSIMTQVGLEDFIAVNEEDYIEKAAQHAQSIESLRQKRGSYRDLMRNSPLMDVNRFTREFSDALESMYQSFLASD